MVTAGQPAPAAPTATAMAGADPRVRAVRSGGSAAVPAIVAVALAAGLGSFYALGGAGSSGIGPTLTTSQIEAQVDPALVDVTSTLGYQQAESLGTGLVLTSNGEILTNNHVIEGATSIKVTDVGNGHSYQAKVVGYNQTQDIAVLQLQGASGLKTVKLGNSDTPRSARRWSRSATREARAARRRSSPARSPPRQIDHRLGRGRGTTEQLTGLIQTTTRRSSRGTRAGRWSTPPAR